MSAVSGLDRAVAAQPGRPGMVWLEGGAFIMGSDRHYAEERPSRQVEVGGFWIDRNPVTNHDFARFVAATGHVTVAEIAPRLEDFPGALPEALCPASLVFAPPPPPVRLDGPPIWWALVPGADWQHPYGPDSSIDGLDDHPVVHVALADVEAYADWVGASLPTEAEWEYAAKGGGESEFAWGDELTPGGIHVANVWQGIFPHINTREDGWAATSPVGSYAANGFGLHDMIGNTWEGTADWWTARPGEPVRSCCSARRDMSIAAGDPSPIPRRVLKGGSHLCAPSYCRRYRPAARHAHPIDTSTSHVGFRCVVRE